MALQCLNGGRLIFNQTSNKSYCECNSCYEGIQCEEKDLTNSKIEFNLDKDRLIVYSIYLCLSLVNNLLSLTIFQGSKRIRRTNIGIYLIIYSCISLIGSILLVVGQSVQYFKPHPFANNEELSEVFYCFLEKSGYQITALLCLWLSALVALERSLIISFNFKMNATRRRSIVILVPFFCFTAIIGILFLFYRCVATTPDTEPYQRLTSGWIYTAAGLGGLIYFLATIFILISFSSHVYHYGTGGKSKKKIFFILLKKHLFIFIPSIVYVLCVVPYQIWFMFRSPRQAYFGCGISTAEYYYKIILQTLPNIPTIVTWCIFVYPSNVHMTEFYTNTWIGKRLAMCRIWM
ncbi:hypothetical protein I4U23_022821 [Adineta vaga]|nr:hypothetical protein I4U23_022821 [Adineta vaga]